MFNVGDKIVLLDVEMYTDIIDFLEEYDTKERLDTLTSYEITRVDSDGIISTIKRVGNGYEEFDVYSPMSDNIWHVWKTEILYNTLDNYKNKVHNTKYADVCRKIQQLYIKHNAINQEGFKFNLGV